MTMHDIYSFLHSENTIKVLIIIFKISAIFITGFITAKLSYRIFFKILKKQSNIELLTVNLLSYTSKYIILLITFIIILAQLGISTASLITTLGAMGLALAWL